MSSDIYPRFIAALIFVVALIGALAWCARRFGWGGALPRRSSPTRRLALVESAQIDGKRRLVLVRRDGVEHLLLLGAGADLLIERGIGSPFDAAFETTGPFQTTGQGALR